MPRYYILFGPKLAKNPLVRCAVNVAGFLMHALCVAAGTMALIAGTSFFPPLLFFITLGNAVLCAALVAAFVINLRAFFRGQR